MKLIIDKRIPAKAKERLSEFGSLIEIETEGIVYDAISGHPDIFCCQTPDGLIIAPCISDQLPVIGDQFSVISSQLSAKIEIGQQDPGMKYPESALYNAVVTKDLVIHNSKFSIFTQNSSLKTQNVLHVDQGYTRCNLMLLDSKSGITSDPGIFKILRKEGFELLYVDPSEVLLPGFDHGFIGGTMGASGDKLFVIGSLTYLSQGDELRSFAQSKGIEIIELYDGPLFDGGSIIIIDGD